MSPIVSMNIGNSAIRVYVNSAIWGELPKQRSFERLIFRIASCRATKKACLFFEVGKIETFQQTLAAVGYKKETFLRGCNFLK